MAEGVLFNIATSVLNNLGSRALAEVASAWGFKSQLEKLTNTMNLIKGVLLDAEYRQWESHAVRCWLDRLKLVVYRADDLFDKITTVAMQIQDKGRNKFTRKVRTFFSHSNQIVSAFTISKEIESIRQDLDDIVKDMKDFGFMVRPFEETGLLLRKKHEACLFLDEEQVIGRDDDKKAIIDMLLAPNPHGHNVSVLPVVGIGGLGKTTLAHIIYNDDGVNNHFDLRLWVSVSETFEVDQIVEKILKLAQKTEPQEPNLGQLQNQLKITITGKKYLLVLDDVWNEDRDKWLLLSALLNKGKEGSKILVTTRSEIVANVMGTLACYSLKGLSERDSWSLFLNMAFEDGVEPESAEVLEAAQKIVKKCANVPLAIRTLGSLLYRKDETTWLNFKDRSLSEISGNVDGIMSILKLSYHHLWSPLKNCFALCALYPKDHVLMKFELIALWMAQGFVIPQYKQSLDDAGEEYFLTLLHRGFFQDVEKNDLGDITSCKMHDLMHDVAQEVARNECKLVYYEEMEFDNRILHLSFDKHLPSFERIPYSMQNLKLLRTFLLPCLIPGRSTLKSSMCNHLLSSFRCLRVLDMYGLGIKSLPSSIGELVHLRCLVLSYTPIETLPDSITELKNLQTLALNGCNKLKRLPHELSRLTTLRYLTTSNCHGLTHMPPGIGKLSSLHEMDYLVVNKRHTSNFWSKPSTAQLNDLENLNSLRKKLRIKILGVVANPREEAKKANLRSKHGLVKLVLEWDDQERGSNCSENDETLLEGLRPHPNLKKLNIERYQGQKLPSWAVNHNLCSSLPNLIEVKLFRCKCEQVPAFSQLPFLKHLVVNGLESVEYMESDLHKATSSLEDETLFFPCLQKLYLWSCSNLKSWWKGGEVANDDHTEWQQHQSTLSFSKLSILLIFSCPNLKSLPLCPIVEELMLVGANKTLSVPKILGSTEDSTSSTSHGRGSQLKWMGIDNLEDLFSLSNNTLHHLSTLRVVDPPHLEKTSEFRDIFTILSVLRKLRFNRCSSLTSLSGSFERLTALVRLDLISCPELDLSTNEGMEEGMPWKALPSLEYLELTKLPKLVALPDGLQCLTNLSSLVIRHNKELTEIPDWISCLSSLEYLHLKNCPKLKSLPEGIRQLSNMRRLAIIECPGLTERCRRPNGEDWPKIQHIRVVHVLEEDLSFHSD